MNTQKADLEEMFEALGCPRHKGGLRTPGKSGTGISNFFQIQGTATKKLKLEPSGSLPY